MKLRKYRTTIMGDDFPPITHMAFFDGKEEKLSRFYLTGYIYFNGDAMMVEYKKIDDELDIADEGRA